MIKNYFLIAFRTLSKNKAFSFINIAGLAIGMAAGLLIIQYVAYELSYDNFHEKKGRIYRVLQDRYNNGKLSTQWAAGAYAAGSAFKTAFPEIEDYVKMVGAGQVLADYRDEKIVVENDYYAGSSFFNIFSYPLIYGDTKTVLKEPNTVAISQGVAQKLFHNINPVGQSLKINENKLFKITGVFKDLPANTHMKLDMLISYSTFLMRNPPKNGFDIDNFWEGDGCLTYLLLKPGVDAKALEAKFVPLVKKAYLPFKGDMAVYTLMPVQNIHLYSHFMGEMQPNGDGKSVYLLAGIAIFIILIAWINYINLATARGINRAKEVGVRKTLGSAKRQLILQFMLEAVTLNGFAILLAIVIIAAFLPVFGKISGYNISFTLLINPFFWITVFIVFVLGSFFSGFYPAIVLSSFKPVDVMKGKISASPGGVMLRKGMVVFQFAASIFLLIGSLTVYRQISFMQKQNLGVNIDQTLVIQPPLAKIDSFYRSMNAFKQESLRQSPVKSITVSTAIPGEAVGWNAGGIKLAGTDAAAGKQYRIIGGDYDFASAYGLKLIAGRQFSKDFSGDPKTVIFSKTGVHQLGFNNPKDAIGKQIDFWGVVYTIIGVVDDFHQQSLHDAYDALIFRLIPDVRGYVSVKLNVQSLPQTISALKSNWNTFFPGDRFEYFFLDQHFNEQYKADQNFGQVFALFTGIAIFVACLGLFGLVSFTIVQRTKEIGIRKVLGASVIGILQLLYRDFAKLILIAFAISAPLGWYATQKWLQTYAFKININWTLFVLPFIAVTLIAFATVSYLSVKAALMNPVKSLKTE